MVGGKVPQDPQKVEEVQVTLGEKTLDRLKKRAYDNGRTVEQEAVEILRKSLIG